VNRWCRPGRMRPAGFRSLLTPFGSPGYADTCPHQRRRHHPPDRFEFHGEASLEEGPASIRVAGYGLVSDEGFAFKGEGDHWGGELELWADNCEMLKFKTSAHLSSVTSGTVSFTVPAGQSETLIGARGVGGYPAYTLTSPQGRSSPVQVQNRAPSAPAATAGSPTPPRTAPTCCSASPNQVAGH
jgi:hypothetical protein